MHSFLDLKTPKDSVATSLNNKIAFTLYQQIQKNTTIANSRSGTLFSDPEKALGTKIDSTADIIYPIKRLMEDKLIAHLFYFSYINKKEFRIQSCFVAVPLERTESIEIIYKNILNISIQNILLQIETHPNFQPEMFKAELLVNLKQSLPLEPENYPNSFIRIFPELGESINSIPIYSKVKETIFEDIEDELISRNKIVKLETGLYFPIAENVMLEKFQIADEFIKKEIAPIYYSVSGKEMEEINEQEQIYSIESFQEPMTSLKKERADILHRIISPYHSKSYPGELAIMTVLLFEKHVLAYLIRKEEILINEEVEKFRDKFLEQSSHWRDILHFFHQDVISTTHPKVWDKLRSDKSLACASWYLPKEEVYVFAPRRLSAFLNCISDMNRSMPEATWKILAVKILIEANEKYLQSLFTNENTVKMYGNLLSKAYMDYFPWYYPLFIYFTFFRNIFFASAKIKIETEQWELESRIRSRKKDYEKARIIKFRKITEEKVIETRRREVIESMDELYFKENIIPTKQLLLQKCRMQNSDVLGVTLKRFEFQIIPIPGEEKNDKQAVLYPMDHEWRSKESRLKKMLSKKLEALESNPPTDKKIITPYKLVLNHIVSRNKIVSKEESEDMQTTSLS